MRRERDERSGKAYHSKYQSVQRKTKAWRVTPGFEPHFPGFSRLQILPLLGFSATDWPRHLDVDVQSARDLINKASHVRAVDGYSPMDGDCSKDAARRKG